MIRSLALCALLAGAAHAQEMEVLEIIPSDEPAASLDLGQALILGLGRPWAEVGEALVAADSGAVEDGAGSLRWRVPTYAVDVFGADVQAARVRLVVLDFSDDGPDFSDYADRLRQRHGEPEPDGFYASDALGLPFDLAVLADRHRLEFRAVPGRTVPADTPLPIQFRAAGADELAPRDTLQIQERVYDFVEDAPEIAGGLAALYQSVLYPADALDDGVGGTVIVQLVVHADGTPADVAAVRSPDERLSAAAVAAVRRTRFQPGRQGGEPVHTRMTVPVRFDAEAAREAARPTDDS